MNIQIIYTQHFSEYTYNFSHAIKIAKIKRLFSFNLKPTLLQPYEEAVVQNIVSANKLKIITNT